MNARISRCSSGRRPNFWSARNANELADTLRGIEIDGEIIDPIVRKKILVDQLQTTTRCKTKPEVVKEELLDGVREFPGADFVCNPLNAMDEKGVSRVEVALHPEDADMTLGPRVDHDDFKPNYLMRDMHLLPKTGNRPEWRHTQDYCTDPDGIPAIYPDGTEFVYAGQTADRTETKIAAGK